MAIALDAQAAIRTSTGNTVTLSSFTIAAGSDKILIVMTTAQDGNHANYPVTGVDWNGTETLTKVREDEAAGNTGTSLWYLLDPTSATADIRATYTGSLGESTVGAYSFTGVNQVAPEANNGATGASTSVDVDLTTIAANTVSVTVTCSEASYASIDDSQTAHTSYPLTDQSFENAHAGRKAHSSAGSKSLDYTSNGNNSFSISALSMAEAVAATAVKDVIGPGVVPFAR